jgi:hypothetical protein
VLVAGALALAFSGSKVESAVREAEKAPASEQKAKVEAAKKLVDALKSPAEQAFYFGRLEEAQDDPGAAAFRYREAAQGGNSDGLSRLISLLEHPKCRVRVYVADSLGELKAKKARGKLEALAEKGGPGENDTPFIGCNSKAAAREALEKLR